MADKGYGVGIRMRVGGCCGSYSLPTEKPYTMRFLIVITGLEE